MAIWNAKPAAQAQAEIDALESIALTKPGNLAGIVDIIVARKNIRAMPKVTVAGVPLGWKLLTHRPFIGGVNAITTVNTSGRIYWAPYASDFEEVMSGLALEVTTAAVAVTYEATFALYSIGSNGVPDALVDDWTSLGSISLVTGGVGYFTMAFANKTIPAGEYAIALLVQGTTITTNPAFRSLSSHHPSVSSTAPLSSNAGFLRTGITSFPNPPAISLTAGSNTPMIYIRQAAA